MQVLIRLLYAQLGIDHTYASAHVPKVTMERPFDPKPSQASAGSPSGIGLETPAVGQPLPRTSIVRSQGMLESVSLLGLGEGLPWPKALVRDQNLGLTARRLQLGSPLAQLVWHCPAQSDGL
jgi:hypothetical protein